MRSMTPETFLARHGRQLHALEVAEVKATRELFYFDARVPRVRPTGSPHQYTTPAGFYKCLKHDHVAFRFQLQASLGCGSFGDVMAARDHKTGRDVALKLLCAAPAARAAAKAEIAILARLQVPAYQTSHVVQLLDSFTFRGHVCIVTEQLRHGDLYALIQRDWGMAPAAARPLAASALQAVHEVHAKGVIHCDIKPENLMLAGKDATEVKLIDFGLSCLAASPTRAHSFGSLLYSAPEVLLDSGYGTPIDMWAMACVVFELVTGTPLFAGESDFEQLALMTRTLGAPPAHVVARGARSSLFFTPAALPATTCTLRGTGFGAPGSSPIASLLRQHGIVDAALAGFLEACLQWDPARRLTAAQALLHPFIAGEPEDTAYAASGEPRAQTSGLCASTSFAAAFSWLRTSEF